MLRDLLLLSLFSYFCFRAFKQPYIGILLMLCIAYLSPHRLASWTYSYSLQLYFIAFVVTLVAFVISKEKDKFPWHRQFILIVIFFLWGAFGLLFAMDPVFANLEFVRSYKLVLGVTLMLWVCQGEHKIKALVWVIALSIAYYGIKGGIFSLTTGTQFRVTGPPGTYIEGNNELAMGILVIIPLLFFLLTEAKIKILKWAFAIGIGLCFISVIGSQSRGALLGLIAMSAFLWLKSKNKLLLAAIGFVAFMCFVPFVSDTWFDRMDTINSYEQDSSATGRINSWTTAINVANDRITGGGYRFWGPVAFALYAPSPKDVHDAHSIYFEVLGELGYPGLIMYLLLYLGWWRMATNNAKLAAENPQLQWCVTLSKMSQVSQISYMSAGAFLGLAYWDMPYHLMTIMILTHFHIINVLEQTEKNRPDINNEVETTSNG